LKDISFSYGGKKVLKNINLSIPKGAFLSIIGQSGAGKTTIVDLITGLLVPQKGEVCLDGIPLSQLDVKAWRQMIGYVPQETLLLHDSIFFNVTLGDKRFSRKDAEDALKKARAWEFISKMPDGIDTMVGERGGMLSGGQRQRITIARALVHRPELLILDEATSALDPSSELEICRVLEMLKGEYTILAISHREALLKAAEKAYLLRNGIIKPSDVKSLSEAT